MQSWVKSNHILTVKAHQGDKRDHDFESTGTGWWPSPLVDPWGGVLHHNEGLARACPRLITHTHTPHYWALEAEETQTKVMCQLLKKKSFIEDEKEVCVKAFHQNWEHKWEVTAWAPSSQNKAMTTQEMHLVHLKNEHFLHQIQEISLRILKKWCSWLYFNAFDILWCIYYSNAKSRDTGDSGYRVRVKEGYRTTVILPEIPFQL